MSVSSVQVSGRVDPWRERTQHRAHAAPVFDQGLDHLAEGEHAHYQVAMLHHHQRANVALGHQAGHGTRQRARPAMVGVEGVRL